MRKIALGAALAVGLSFPVLAAEMSASGTVSDASAETGKFMIGDQTFVMDKQAGTSMMPKSGDPVTVFYEERGGEKVVTRIGQKSG